MCKVYTRGGAIAQHARALARALVKKFSILGVNLDKIDIFRV
jgi:hypothetical protein